MPKRKEGNLVLSTCFRYLRGSDQPPHDVITSARTREVLMYGQTQPDTAIPNARTTCRPPSCTQPPLLAHSPAEPNSRISMPSNNEKETKNPNEVPEKDKPPSKEKAWQEVMKRVEEIDGGMERGWKEDIDTLLVFAGLFSAVVTAFTIESYQWLSEDPSDQNIAILTHISTQFHNQSASAFEPTPFVPSASVIRINVFWFLSLILALVDALFGLMCKQWLREFRRPTKTRTPEQWLSLRCFRSESFERWHVPSFLAALPIILEMALFCFFAGLLELLWTKHPIPFAFAVIVIGCAVTFYIATTILPGIDIIRLVIRVHPGIHAGGWPLDNAMTEIPEVDYLCPYKSPQAWAMFKGFAWTLGSSSPLPRRALSYWLRKWFRVDSRLPDLLSPDFADRLRHWRRIPNNLVDRVRQRLLEPDDLVDIVQGNLRNLGDWFSVDLDMIERFSRIRFSDERHFPDIYELKAHRWLTHEFRDIPLMLPHLQTLLQALSPQLVMPGVFDSNFWRLDREWTTTDVENRLKEQYPRASAPFSYSRLQLRLLAFHFVQTPTSRPLAVPSYYTPSFSWNESHLCAQSECFVPFTRIFQWILGNDTRAKALLYIKYFLQHHADIHIDPRAFDFTSICPLLGSLATADLHLSDIKVPFFDLLTLINTKLREGDRMRFHADPYSWIDGLDAFRVSQELPKDCFARHTGCFSVSMDRLNTLLSDPTTNGIALEYVQGYYQVLDTNRSEGNLFCLFLHLRTYVLHNIPADLEKYPPHLQEELKKLEEPFGTSADEIPCVLRRQETLSFLKSFNETTKDEVRLSFWETLWRSWDVSLKCVAHLNELPLDYFDTPNSRSNPTAIDGDAPGGAGAGSTAAGPSTSANEEPEGERPVKDIGLGGEAEGGADASERHSLDQPRGHLVVDFASQSLVSSSRNEAAFDETIASDGREVPVDPVGLSVAPPLRETRLETLEEEVDLGEAT
ncbi:hypothetical protein PM082_004239 [Marasmius tenuissimus]|nr:hypothetical protein PM082_004239 [Marasmius tenuissimus]